MSRVLGRMPLVDSGRAMRASLRCEAKARRHPGKGAPGPRAGRFEAVRAEQMLSGMGSRKT